MTSVLSMETTADPGDRLSQQCSSCDGSSASCWCLDCNEALCDVCMSAHRRVTVTRTHRILNQPPAGHVSTPPTKFCRLHPSEPLKLFCFTCNQLTCRDCQLMTHMNHRYQFVSEALDSMKKELEVWIQPIRAHRDTARQSLLDMETRLQDIVECESLLKAELQHSYSVITQHLKNRMDNHLKEVKKVCEKESEQIQRRMMKVKQLQQKQQSVTETAEKARNTNDLSALLTYRAQVEFVMKDLPDEDASPPQTMSELKVITDNVSLEAILNFGEVDISWIPFSVSQTSNQNTDTPASSSSSSPPTPICPAPSCKPLPQTRTTNDISSPVPVKHLASSHRSSSNQLCLPPSSSCSSSSSAITPPTPTCPAPSCKPLPQTRNTCGTDSPVPVSCPSSSWKSSSNQLSPQPSSCWSNQSNAPVTTTTTGPSAQTVVRLSSSTVKTLSHLETNPSQVLLQILPVAASHKETSNHQPLTDSSSAITSGPLSSDVRPQQQSPVVRAVADSACDRGLQQVAAKQQEPAENEPTSTVSEETEPAGKPPAPEVFDGDAEESSSVIGHSEDSLSQWQPRVSLFRLPVPPPRPGRPLPAFRLVRGDAEDEIYLKEMSNDAQSHVDDITDESPVTSPESPVTLVIVSCSACGSANSSIICSACGRGYHRDCHVPPVGPDIWSEWICSLCQDLSDPSDPYSSDRPQRPQSPCLSLVDQRRCEGLLLHLKVEGCTRLSERGRVWSRLKMMSERLHRSPAYKTAAEFLSDVWSLFLNASQDDDVLNKLQESFQIRLMETFSSELHPSVLMPPRGGGTAVGRPDDLLNTKMSHGDEVLEDFKGSKVTSEKQKVITSESKLKETKKRLRDFLDLMGTSGFKRRKTDKVDD